VSNVGPVLRCKWLVFQKEAILTQYVFSGHTNSSVNIVKINCQMMTNIPVSSCLCYVSYTET